MTVVSQQQQPSAAARAFITFKQWSNDDGEVIQQYYRFFHILIQNLPSTDRLLSINSDDSKYDGP